MSCECNGRTRRGLFRYAGRALAALGAAGSIEKFTEASASAQNRERTATRNRSLVAIYLVGGNDSNNMLVPLSAGQYESYAQARGSLALDSGSLLEVTAARSQDRFGFHPALGSLRSLFASKNLAVVSNVGPIERPLDKSSGLRGVSVPRNFGEHGDHSTSYLPGGYMVPAWAARMAGLESGSTNQRSISFDTGLTAIYPDSQIKADDIRKGMLGAPLRTRFPATALGAELQQAARLIQFGSRAGSGRQILTATLSGFDTHSDQPARQTSLFATLDSALTAFYEATLEMGVADRVTTFTLSEFNRTLRVNSKNGTDHGWGGHQLVLGGAVLGGDVHGVFPSLSLGGPDDLGSSGVWIPSTARDQYEATLASWFGVNTADLARHFPHLTAFPKSTLEFLA